jgi:hypothetical protein
MVDPKISRRMLRTPAAASYVGLAPRTLEKYRLRGGGPAYYRLSGHAVVYDVDDLDLWLTSRRRASTSDHGGHAPG